MNLLNHPKVIVFCMECVMPDIVESVLDSGVSADTLVEGLCDPEDLMDELCAGAAVVFCEGSEEVVQDAIEVCGLQGLVGLVQYAGTEFDPLRRSQDLLVNYEHALTEGRFAFA